MTEGARGVLAVAVVAIVLALVGCDVTFPQPGGPPDAAVALDFDRFLERHHSPESPYEAPLEVGEHWVYRDAASSAGGATREERVLATVNGGDGKECYLTQITLANGDVERQYLHRSADGLVLVAVDRGDGAELVAGAPLVLPLPLLGDAGPRGWSYDVLEQAFDAQVIFTETLVLPSGTFRDCRKLKLWAMDAGGCRCHSSAEAEFRWYAPGVGLVKLVEGSRSFDLVTASVLQAATTRVVGWEASGGSIVLGQGDRLIVQLPVALGDGCDWQAAVAPTAVLDLVDQADYADVPSGGGVPHTGTHVATFAVAAAAVPVAGASLSLIYGAADAAGGYRFELSVAIE